MKNYLLGLGFAITSLAASAQSNVKEYKFIDNHGNEIVLNKKYYAEKGEYIKNMTVGDVFNTLTIVYFDDENHNGKVDPGEKTGEEIVIPDAIRVIGGCSIPKSKVNEPVARNDNGIPGYGGAQRFSRQSKDYRLVVEKGVARLVSIEYAE